MAHKIGHVLGTFAQRRQTHRRLVEAEEQVLAEQALLDQAAQVAVGGGDDPHIWRPARARVQGRLSAVDDPQQAALGTQRRELASREKELAAARESLETARSSLAAREKELAELRRTRRIARELKLDRGTVDFVDNYDGPGQYPEPVEEIDDRCVVWVVGDNGVGRVEVQQ